MDSGLVPSARPGMTTVCGAVSEIKLQTLLQTHHHFLAAHFASELCWSHHPLNRRGRREDRMPGQHPWPPCVKKCTGQEPQAWPMHPGLPCATVYGLYALSSVRRAFWPPSSARCGASSPTWYQRRGIRTTRLRRPRRIVRPHGKPHCDTLRPSHPAPDVRDDREAPLSW